jgi:hypothetical protein
VKRLRLRWDYSARRGRGARAAAVNVGAFTEPTSRLVAVYINAPSYPSTVLRWIRSS